MTFRSNFVRKITIMSGISTGHYIFAVVFVVVFLGAMVFAYRRDFRRSQRHYKKVWLVLLGIVIVYFLIVIMNRIL